MASSQYRDEGKIIHVELIRGQFHVRKKRRFRKTAKNIHYIMKRDFMIGFGPASKPAASPPRYMLTKLKEDPLVTQTFKPI